MNKFPKSVDARKFFQQKELDEQEKLKQWNDALCHHRKQIVKLLKNGAKDNFDPCRSHEYDNDSNSNDDNDDDDDDDDKLIIDESTSVTYMVSSRSDSSLFRSGEDTDIYQKKYTYICSTIVKELKQRKFNASYKFNCGPGMNNWIYCFEIYVWTRYPPKDY